MIINTLHNNMLNSPVRKFEGRVEIYEGSTLTLTCGCHDALKSYTLERLGEEGKFFGFGVCQKLKVSLIDKERKINVSTANTLEIVFGVDSQYLYPCPRFHITEVNRDENTNELSITAYDDLIVATAYLVSEMNLETPYTIRMFAAQCAAALGIPINMASVAADEFSLPFPEGANFGGSETIRQALNAVAEATQTIYFINHNWELEFKRLDRDGKAALTITKDNYFSLDSRTNRRLSYIAHITDLGDNIIAATGASGTTQYVRNNPFWTLRNDVGTLLEAAIDRVGGLTINQFDCEWRGNYLLELGDKIDLVTKDNKTVTSFLLNDTVIFDGALSQHSEWSYADNDVETAANPANLGTALNQTFARVDKINKRIDLVVEDVSENRTNIGQLVVRADGIAASLQELSENTTEEFGNVRKEVNDKAAELQVSIDGVSASVKSLSESTTSRFDTVNGQISGVQKEITDKTAALQVSIDGINGNISQINTKIDEDITGVRQTIDERATTLQANIDGISASVSNIQTNIDKRIDGVDDEIDSVRQQVDLKMSSTDVQITIEQELAKGVDKVTTSTGYTFNEEGMTVSKTGSEMTTTISEDGMKVYRNSEEVLTADNQGVKAEDLHATTYLIVGNNSRFEDYDRGGEARTGCFWIGG